MNKNYTRVKTACYTSNITMAIVGNVTPLLFLTFRSQYGISYSLLGFLVLINFFTQLSIDLIFSFFSHKFNIPKVVKTMPLFSLAGLLLFVLLPTFFPDNAYFGLAVGTVLFSVASGLAEVLISPIIAAIPAKDPDREMSKLHSVYAWGTVGVVIVGTLYLLLFSLEKWQGLIYLCMLVPLISFFCYCGAEIPAMQTPEKVTGVFKFLKNKSLWACFFAIFLGGASEVTMAQWSSGYLEAALGIPKVWGDIFGVALFAVMLGLGRSLYGKIGKNIRKVILAGGIGAAVCYFVSAVSPFPVVGLFACALTGFCVSMLWPGSLIVASERFPTGGVFIYAMMAAGGDFGASVGPQLVGIVTDFALNNSFVISLANEISLAPEQLGMKIGMIAAMLFPLFSIPLYYKILKNDKKSLVKE